MEPPKNEWFVDVSPFPFGGIFRFHVSVYTRFCCDTLKKFFHIELLEGLGHVLGVCWEIL